MRLLHQLGQVCPGGEEFNIQQVSTVGVKDRVEQIGVFRVTQCEFSALCLRAEGHQQQLVPQDDPHLCQTAGNSTGGTGTFKMVHAPFHTICLQSGKLRGSLQNAGLGMLYDGDDDFGAALSDEAAADGDAGHGVLLIT